MAFTKAQLEALKNTLLASNQPILASQHRQQIQSIIDEMYDAQSRGNILVGVQSDTVQGGSDTFLVFRSGQAYQLPVSLLNANDLASLGDVFINNLEDGETLVYDAIAGRWENRNIFLGFQEISEKGQPDGYASLDSTGKVPASQLPSYVDDVLEFANLASFPVTGESGKIYVTLDTNKTYRWSGSAYIEISEGVILGENSTTAYRGDRGKIAYDYSQIGHLPLSGGTVSSLGSVNTLNINHDSGSGLALNVIKGGNGEGLRVEKTSGSGNAATIIGTLQATTIVKSGGLASQFLKADGSVDSSAYVTGSGTLNFIPKFSPNGTTLGNSQIFDNGTNVGIGTTTPSTRLSFGIEDIIGEIGRIGFDVGTNQRSFISANRTVASGQLSTLSFGTSGSERVTIGVIGEVTVNNLAGTGSGIVGTDASGNLIRYTIGSGLTLTGTTLTASGGSTTGLTGSGTANIISMWSGATSLTNSVLSQGGSDARIVAENSINGDARLAVVNTNTGSSAVAFNYAMTTGNRYLGFVVGGANRAGTTAGLSNASLAELQSAGNDITNLLIHAAGNYPMVFAINNAERMRIASNGNLLLNTTTDNGSRLQVNGNVSISSVANASGDFLTHTNGLINKRTASQLASDIGAVTVGSQSVRNISNGRMQTTTSAYESIFIPGQGSNILLPQRLREFDISKMATFDSVSIKVYFNNSTSNSNKLGTLKFSFNEFVNEDFLEITSSGSNPYSGWFEINILNIGLGLHEVFGFVNAVQGSVFSNSCKFYRILSVNNTCRVRLEFFSGIVSSANYGGATDIQYTIDYKKSDNSLLIN